MWLRLPAGLMGRAGDSAQGWLIHTLPAPLFEPLASRSRQHVTLGLQVRNTLQPLVPACRAHERAWRVEDLEQRGVAHARRLWARYRESNRRDVEERTEQLRSFSNLSAYIAGFAGGWDQQTLRGTYCYQRRIA